MKISFETKGDFEEIRKFLDNVSKNDPSMALSRIANDGEKSLSRNTPRDTGATASGWRAEITTKDNNSEIAWRNIAHPNERVNVAKIIDQGHATGTGGYVPPKPYIQKAMESIWKTAGDDIAKELIK